MTKLSPQRGGFVEAFSPIWAEIGSQANYIECRKPRFACGFEWSAVRVSNPGPADSEVSIYGNFQYLSLAVVAQRICSRNVSDACREFSLIFTHKRGISDGCRSPPRIGTPANSQETKNQSERKHHDHYRYDHRPPVGYRHDIPDPGTLNLGPDEGQSDVAVTVTLGRMKCEVLRYVGVGAEGGVEFSVSITGVPGGPFEGELELRGAEWFDLSQLLITMIREWVLIVEQQP